MVQGVAYENCDQKLRSARVPKHCGGAHERIVGWGVAAFDREPDESLVDALHIRKAGLESQNPAQVAGFILERRDTIA
jgi:hypothetical protein